VKIKIVLMFLIPFLVGCSTTALVKTESGLPDSGSSISLFELNNYTDTPRAGSRSANIIEGILLTKGFVVKNNIDKNVKTFEDSLSIAKEDGSKYMFIGGVSEWRYKTGIDGEPAVSFQCSIYDTQTSKLVWSATGSDSDWGNGSIGTTAQELLENMMQ
jgi:hypothetical protein